MATNGFGSIYPRSYWGVTDSENGFGNVYKDLAGYPTIEFTLGEIVFLDGYWRVRTYLTNPAIPAITFGLVVETNLHFYNIDGEEISSQNNDIEAKSTRLEVENNMLLIGSNLILGYNTKMAYAKGEILAISSNEGDLLSNPFEVDGTNYLVKLTPSV
jgi:hypothetical protein